ncbi:MAG: peptidase C26 [Planctomycetaceae bacterium]|jgi:putative glutamine amidotransferase|nr:peptidase C26 [Planctomycetaceae bacterium]MDP7277735.1 gamma-glutamyl-gamma-aminobutyrate hydrolase family protein [Planctomycetaceae bacterium]
MSLPLIGITTYGRGEDGRFSLPDQYVTATRRAGGLVVLLPPGETFIDELFSKLDGIVLAGGGDIDPDLYGGELHPEVYMVDPDRDALELALTRRVLSEGLPTLAICRGAQMVNIALGGTLHEHLPDVVGESIKHRLPPREPTPHPVTLVEETGLARLLGQSTFDAASWHHQAVDRAGRGLVVSAHAADGTIEALELPDHPWLYAVQWHPELTAETDPIQQTLFNELVTACRQDIDQEC